MDNYNKKKMWLDCDPGHDDLMAIYMAAYADNIELLGKWERKLIIKYVFLKGISTVYGNSSLEKVTNNTLKILKMGGISHIPVYKGMS